MWVSYGIQLDDLGILCGVIAIGWWNAEEIDGEMPELWS